MYRKANCEYQDLVNITISQLHDGLLPILKSCCEDRITRFPLQSLPQRIHQQPFTLCQLFIYVYMLFAMLKL